MADNKPTVYWILQKNHITPHIILFLKAFKKGATGINLQFLIPAMWENTLKSAVELEPISFHCNINQIESYEWFCRKRDSIQDVKFKDGLPAWRTLILDDLNAGHVHPVTPQLPENPNLQFIIMQPPIPLGSFENEERVFYACMHWAHMKKIPVIGYELLAFDTRWSLIPAILDGVITTNERSYDWLTSERSKINTKTWLLPRFEREFFSPSSTIFWKNALGLPYFYIEQYKIPDDKIIIYLPHNVGLIYEFKQAIKELSKKGDQIHLMIALGKDQVRGTHSHEQIIRTLSQDDLNKFHSYSFHDINQTLDMASADMVITCSSCHFSNIANSHAIPVLIIDPDTPAGKHGYIEITNHYSRIKDYLSIIIDSHKKVKMLGKIISEILSVTTKNRLKRL